MVFLNSLKAVLNRRADVHKGLDLVLKPAVYWDKCTTRHARVKNSLLHTESRELFTGRHARIKHTETAVSQSLRSVCCLLSLTLCLSRFKPITVFFLRCSQHTHTYAITETLFNKSWISSSRTTHHSPCKHTQTRTQTQTISESFFFPEWCCHCCLLRVSFTAKVFEERHLSHGTVCVCLFRVGLCCS